MHLPIPYTYPFCTSLIVLYSFVWSWIFDHGIKEMLPPTDSRLRPDQRHLENGEYDKANVEKLRLEQRQRIVRCNLFFPLAFSISTCGFLFVIHYRSYISVEEVTREWVEAKMVSEREWRRNLSVRRRILGSKEWTEMGRLPGYIWRIESGGYGKLEEW